MIYFFANAAPLLIGAMNSLLLLWGFYEILMGGVDYAKNQFDPESPPTKKFASGLFKILAFLFVGMIHTDLELKMHPLYIFSNNVTDNINGIGEFVWFGSAIIVTINFTMIAMISLSKFNVAAKLIMLSIFVAIIEAVNNFYNYLVG